MNAVVQIPSALQKYVGNQSEVTVSSETVGGAFNDLVTSYGDLKSHLYDEQGRIRSFINIYVNDEDIRYGKNLDTEIRDGDVIQIVPSIAGGRGVSR